GGRSDDRAPTPARTVCEPEPATSFAFGTHSERRASAAAACTAAVASATAARDSSLLASTEADDGVTAVCVSRAAERVTMYIRCTEVVARCDPLTRNAAAMPETS